LETNVDDVSGEIIGDACERLRAAGALDVYTNSIGMKKNRPGTKITILAAESDVDQLRELLFVHTQTLGIRSWKTERVALPRRRSSVATRFGAIDGVVSVMSDGRENFVPEYESCRQAAELQGVPVLSVYNEARQCLPSRSTMEGG
jgi:uncharacterized protein (DUF111 family)